ncbi:MAG TPA: DUF202 domain-containing protein [Dehalococcoidales bacterium]
MNEREPQNSNRRVRMANERTFLAWVRTSIAIMAFGFVVERFSLFIREVSSILDKSGNSIPPSHGYAAIIGIILVALGIVLGTLSFLRYRNAEKQIDNDSYRPSLKLDFLVAGSVLLVGILLIAYLVYNFATVGG